jgi:squalene-associated FAD-dependent desaturase
MKRAIVHIVGAGLSGLSAAWNLARSGATEIIIHEALPHAGGRRRSFFDEALGLTIDSGNFPLLAAHRAALAMIEAVGARGEWRALDQPGAAFVDMSNAERWTLRPNAGRIPWWLLVEGRRAPRTTLSDYWAARRLISAPPQATVADIAPPSGPLFDRLWRPLTLAALNAEPKRASARLAGHSLSELLQTGGGARAFLPINGFGRALVDPALRSLRRSGVSLRFERRLREINFTDDRASGLEFEHDRVDLGPDDRVVLATPAPIAASLAQWLETPRGYNSAITVHFACPPPKGAPAILGIVNGAFDWLFSYADRLSVTILDAGERIDLPREDLAAQCWRDIAALTGLSDERPGWRVVPLRRASFVVTPEEEARRPPCRTKMRNLYLAGAYVQSAFPDSVEAAVRSGGVAARCVEEDSGAA